MEYSEFFPTPETVIYKLLSGIDYRILSTCLEPSAGKGNIANHIFSKMKRPYDSSFKPNIDVIEIQPDLQHVLRGNGLRLIHDDFLTLDTYKQYDLIAMNPPFSNGDEHLLKAIELQSRYGGEIRCILNAETVKNPFSNKRKELVKKLTDLDAEIEFMQDAFKTAERKTGVEIAIIKVKIPKKEIESKIFDDMKKAFISEEQEQKQTTDIITKDHIKGIIQQYKFEIKLGLKLIDEAEFMESKILKSFKGDRGSILVLALNEYSSHGSPDRVNRNEYLKMVRTKYWTTLFENKEFTGLLTENLRSDYISKVEELAAYDFTEFNIYTIKIEMNKGIIKGVENTILALFEEFSNKYHYYDECSKNVHYYNGWKTNKSYIIGNKVIIPCQLGIGYDSKYIDGKRQEFNAIKGNVQKLIDAEKVFNYLDGGLSDGDDIQICFDKAALQNQSSKIKCKYFELTFYKKGTCHITFTNSELLKKFNIFGSQKKGWLPPSYGKKKYTDMSQAEKEVINEFEGEESYNKVLKAKGYYLADTASLLMLEASNEN